MIRLLQGLSGLAILLAGGVLARCARQWAHSDSARDPRWERPGAVATFLQSSHEVPGEIQEQMPPLLAAASALAAYLNPPVPPKPPVAQKTAQPVPPAPAVRPPTASPKFKLCGTSCCDDRPERSMALILEPDGKDGARWVRSGTQIGHLLIEEIRPGSIVYRDGEDMQEMAIERSTAAVAVAAEGSGSLDSRPSRAVQAQSTPPPGSTRRPTPARSMTVGSARTAALN